jgi:hypothetical protein
VALADGCAASPALAAATRLAGKRATKRLPWPGVLVISSCA